MQELAEQHSNVHYLPIAEYLHNYPAHEIFLDDCHLTEQGHQLLANELYEFIQQEKRNHNER